MSKDKITEVCHECGVTANVLTCLKKYGTPPKKLTFDVSTYHRGKCDVCGETKSVTEPRDFFYPDFKLINEYAKGNIEVVDIEFAPLNFNE